MFDLQWFKILVDRGTMEPQRSWSCSTLMRGSSFLAEQMKANEKKQSYDDILGVSGLQSGL